MVETLIEGGQSAKRKIVVAGEMLELGVDEAKIHTETGKKMAASGIDVLYRRARFGERIGRRREQKTV